MGEVAQLPADEPAHMFIPSDVSVGRARELLGDATALPVRLARKSAGHAVIAEILGAVSASRLAAAPDADPVTDHLDPPLPVIGVREPVDVAVQRLSADSGPVVLARDGYAVAVADAGILILMTMCGHAESALRSSAPDAAGADGPTRRSGRATQFRVGEGVGDLAGVAFVEIRSGRDDFVDAVQHVRFECHVRGA